MKAMIRRRFAVETRNALHIRPPTQPTTKSPVRKIMNLELPLWQKIPQNFNPKPPMNIAQFSDRIPENHLKLSVSKSPMTEIQKIREAFPRSAPATPFILGEKPIVPIKSIVVVSKVLQTSAKRACIVTNTLIGKYFYDAVVIANTLEKKVAKFLLKTLQEEGEKAIAKHELDPKYLFVTSIVINRTNRVRRIRYHARGRSGVKNRDFCLFKLTLSEKPLREFYKQLIVGRSPPYLTYLIKNHLIQNKASYEEVRELQGLLHAKGRQQQKLMFKRKVLTKMVDFKRKGHIVRLKLLWEKMLEEEATNFEEKFGYLFSSPGAAKAKRIEDRKAVFEQNQAENN